MSQNIRFEFGNNVGPDENHNYKSCKLITTFSMKNPERKIQPSGSKCLQLRLKLERMPRVVYTRYPFGQQGASIEVALVDGLTGKTIKSGSEASAEVEIVALSTEFNKNDTDNWSSEVSEAYILEGRTGKISTLGGNRINLIEGYGSLNDVFFRNTRSPWPITVVRLGARVIYVGDSYDGTRIKEAVSEPFTVNDYRAMPKENRQLSLTDKVTRLKNIGKDGPSHKKLRTHGIDTVKDFLTKYSTDRENLKNVLGATMSLKNLEETINHAKTCEHDTKKHLYVFLTPEQNAGLVFESVKEEMDSFSSEAKISATSNVVCGILKGEASNMVVAHFKNSGEDVPVGDDSSKPFLVANSDGTKSVDPMDAFGQVFNIQGLESTTDAFTEDEHLWQLLDRDMITRAFCDNEYPHYFDPMQSTMFCSPADLHGVLQELPVRDVPLDKTQKGWKFLFSTLRWLSIRRIVARKHPVRGIKRYRHEELFYPGAAASLQVS